MWNSGISNWGAGSTEGNSLGMGKKRSYNDTGFSSDNNGSGFGPPPNSYMKTEFGFVFHYFAHILMTKPQNIQKQITLDKLFKSNVEFPFLNWLSIHVLQGKIIRKNVQVTVITGYMFIIMGSSWFFNCTVKKIMVMEDPGLIMIWIMVHHIKPTMKHQEIMRKTCWAPWDSQPLSLPPLTNPWKTLRRTFL